MLPIMYPCSPEAAKFIESYEDKVGTFKNVHHRLKYPFDAMPIGFCFVQPLINESKLRQIAWARGKKSGKKFAVIKHTEDNQIEVARIA